MAVSSRWAFDEGASLDLSIVVVTWNSAAWIAACLGSIDAGCPGLTYEVIVQDNASSDGTVERVAAAGDRHVKLTASTSNRGFAAGANAALRRARGRFVMLLNPDCELTPGSVTALCRWLEANPSHAGVVPQLFGPGGESQRSFQLRRFPTLGSVAAEVLLLDKLAPSNRATARYRYADLELSGPADVEQPAAAALLLRRAVLEQVGGFDERFVPAWFEDVDYCRRIAAAGLRLAVLPEVRVVHGGGSSLEFLPFPEFLRVWYRNLRLYVKKWFPPAKASLLRWVIVAGMLLRSVAVLGGVARPQAARLTTCRAYLAVAWEALRRWDDESRSY